MKRNSSHDIKEKEVLIAIIGTLESLKRNVISIEEAEKFLFSPYMAEMIEEKKYRPEIVHIIECGCELEDVESLLPQKLQNSISDLQDVALSLLKQYPMYDMERWLE